MTISTLFLFFQPHFSRKIRKPSSCVPRALLALVYGAATYGHQKCWVQLVVGKYASAGEYLQYKVMVQMSANAFSHVYIWVTLVFDGLMLCWLLVLFSSSCIAYTSCSHILTYINTHIPYIMMHTYIFVTVMLLRLCTSAFTYACKMCEFAEITRPFMQSLSFVLCAHI